MKSYELLKLRKQILQEQQRRRRLNELLKTELIQEFMELTDINVEALNDEDTREILLSILNQFTVKETNGIYVCTGTFFTDWDICYEETTHHTMPLAFDSEFAEFRRYRDIEDGNNIRAYMKKAEHSRFPQLLAAQFEKEHIVLNPYNTEKNENGYAEVREKFFATAVEQGQGKAKRLILEQYPRM